MREEEHQIQSACVRWFAYQHPELKGLLFAVPNGGARNKATAGKLKAEGVVAGVSDLILLVPRIICGVAQWHGLCIEMKKPGGYQSPEQRQWEATVNGYGYKYAVCHSLDEFINEIEDYL